MGRKIKNTLFFVLFLALLISFISFTAPTQALEEGYCIDVTITDINPSSVEIDEEFTVGILIDNCGMVVPTTVVFELKDISPYIDVKEALIKDIGALGYANSDRFLLYHMKTLLNAIPGEYEIDYKITYGRPDFMEVKEGSFSITVIGEEAEMSIASLKTKPTLPEQGDTVELTIRIENYGDGDANSVKMTVDHPFQGMKESFVGTLEAGEDGPVVFTFIAAQAGEFNIPIVISYEDDFGDHVIETSIQITILEKTNNLALIFSIILVIVIFFVAVFYLLSKAKKKEKIIKQLLNENHKMKEPPRPRKRKRKRKRK